MKLSEFIRRYYGLSPCWDRNRVLVNHVRRHADQILHGGEQIQVDGKVSWAVRPDRRNA